MTENLIILPLVFSFFGAVLLLFSNKDGFARDLFASAVLAANLLISCYFVWVTYQGKELTTNLGNWTPPFGIAIRVDLFSALMLAASNLVFLTTTLFGWIEKNHKKSHFLRLPLIFFLQVGSQLSFMTGDLFNLFVAFEVMLASSYAIMSLEVNRERKRVVYYYMIVNMVASFLFLGLAALAYGSFGNLNYLALSEQLRELRDHPLTLYFGFFALLIFGLKAGIFPLYFWLPDTYPSLPDSLAALFSGVLTKVGIYVLIRVFVTILPPDLPWVTPSMMVVAGLTMLLGVLGAISKHTIKGILCYHIVSQIGYMIFALSLFTEMALAASILFTIHNMIVKTSLILIGGIIYLMLNTEDLKEAKGALYLFPLAGLFFVLQSFSLAGLPPLSGFWGKYLIFREGLELQHYVLVAVAVITSFCTLYSMIKIWSNAFMGAPEDPHLLKKRGYKRFLLVTSSLVVVSLLLGFGAQPFIDLTKEASFQLMSRGAA